MSRTWESDVQVPDRVLWDEEAGVLYQGRRVVRTLLQGLHTDIQIEVPLALPSTSVWTFGMQHTQAIVRYTGNCFLFSKLRHALDKNKFTYLDLAQTAIVASSCSSHHNDSYAM